MIGLAPWHFGGEEKSRRLNMPKTIKDDLNRVWTYCTTEGTWSHGKHLVGCGFKNKSKWSKWDGTKYPEEFNTLRDAMHSCRDHCVQCKSDCSHSSLEYTDGKYCEACTCEDCGDVIFKGMSMCDSCMEKS